MKEDNFYILNFVAAALCFGFGLYYLFAGNMKDFLMELFLVLLNLPFALKFILNKK